MKKRLLMFCVPLFLLLAILAPSISVAAGTYAATVTVNGEEYEITSEGTHVEIDIDTFLHDNGLNETDKLEMISIHTPEGAESVSFNFGELLSSVFWDQEVEVVENKAQLSLPAVLKFMDEGSDGVTFTNLVQLLHPFNGTINFDAIVNFEDGSKETVSLTFKTGQELVLPGEDNVDITSFSLITKDGKEIKATGKNNNFSINFAYTKGNREVTAVMLKSPTAKTVSVFSKSAVFYGDALDIHFFDNVAMLTTSHFEFDPELAEIVGSDKPDNLFTVQELKEVMDQLGDQTVRGIVADENGNESFFDVTFKTASWAKKNGKWYYYELDDLVKGWLQIDEDWFYLDRQTGEMHTGWSFINKKWYFFNKDGYMQTGFVTDKGKSYFLEESGAMRDIPGWFQIDGTWYYFNGDGSIHKGWRMVNSKWYFFNTEGKMQTGFVTDKGKTYYLDASGTMRNIQGFFEINGAKYYFNADGSIHKGWKTVSGKQYFFSSDGKMVVGPRWFRESAKWYYLDNTGAAVKGWLLDNNDGKWYYLDNNGVMKTGWILSGGKWYFLENSGAMKTGWLKDGGKTYFLEKSGAMKTGWLLDGGKWYFFEKSGTMKTGWLLDRGNWYYHSAEGVMQTGWVQVNYKWYYFYNDGKMAFNTIIDGYKLGKDGAWIR